jgi:putative endonuclease
MEHKGYVYFVSNCRNTVLYIGVTNSLKRRAIEHSKGVGSQFTSKYRCGKLVYYEAFPDIEQAIAREKLLKRYKRQWKNALVEKNNPSWSDLGAVIIADPLVL